MQNFNDIKMTIKVNSSNYNQTKNTAYNYCPDMSQLSDTCIPPCFSYSKNGAILTKKSLIKKSINVF